MNVIKFLANLCNTFFYQVTLKLQALETISPESEVKEGTNTRCNTHDTKTMQCIHTKSTAVTLHIPLNVVNSFSTNIVLVRWQVSVN